MGNENLNSKIEYKAVDKDCFYSWHGVEVKDLHGLQNLFFFLNESKELECELQTNKTL